MPPFFVPRPRRRRPRHLCEKYDHWYSTDFLPWTMRVSKCQKA